MPFTLRAPASTLRDMNTSNDSHPRDLGERRPLAVWIWLAVFESVKPPIHFCEGLAQLLDLPLATTAPIFIRRAGLSPNV